MTAKRSKRSRRRAGRLAKSTRLTAPLKPGVDENGATESNDGMGTPMVGSSSTYASFDRAFGSSMTGEHDGGRNHPEEESDLYKLNDEENDGVPMFKEGRESLRSLTLPSFLQTGQAEPSSIFRHDYESAHTYVNEGGHTSDNACEFGDYLVDF